MPFSQLFVQNIDFYETYIKEFMKRTKALFFLLIYCMYIQKNILGTIKVLWKSSKKLKTWGMDWI